MSSATKFVGTGANTARSGSSVSWGSASNITADDGSVSEIGGDLGAGQHTDYLTGTMTGNLFAVPSDQLIDGVEIKFEHSLNSVADGTQLVDSIRLVSSLGNGTDLGDDADITTATPTLRTYGSPTELHGLALTPAVVNAGSFGFELSIKEGTGSGNGKRAQVDYFEITVYYHDGITAEKGTVTLTGKAASFKFPVMGADKGSASVTGKAASMRYVHRMVADKGSVTVTGKHATMESTQDWLENEKAHRVILVELTETDDTVHYLSQGGYVSQSTDTPASQYYKNVIDGEVRIESRASGPFNLRGGTSNLGDIIVANLNGDFDGWAEKNWKSVKIKYGEKTWPLARFRTHWQGYVLEAEETDQHIRFASRDKYEDLQRPAQYTEQHRGPEWGARHPLCYGYPKNVTPMWEQLDTTPGVRVHEGNICEDVAVARYLNQAVSTSPNITKGDARIEFAADPGGALTVDIKGVQDSGGTWFENPGEILQDILTRSVDFHMGTVVSGSDSPPTIQLDYRGSDSDDHYNNLTIQFGVPGDATWADGGTFDVDDYVGSTKTATGLSWIQTPAAAPKAGDLWAFGLTAGSPPQALTMQAGPWTTSDLNTASFTSLDTDLGSPQIGLWVDDDASCVEVMERVLGPGGWHAINGTRLEVGLLIDPDGETAELSFTDRDTLGDMSILAVQPPAWKLRVGYDKNHTVSRGSVDSSVDPDRLSWVQKEYRWAQRMDESIREDNERAVVRDIETVLTKASEAETEADRLWTLFKVQRYVYAVETTAKGIGARLGKIVSFTDDRHGLSSGDEFMVLGKTDNLTRGICEMEVWH